jgi:tRNA pseudouridine55 synthase
MHTASGQPHTLEELVTDSVILIDKPYTWTSFDVVNKIKWFARHQLGLPPFKIGHAGTLDPLATGLLVVCTGKATKRIASIQGGEKEYLAALHFGQTTPSFDLETEPEGNFPIGQLGKEQLNGVLGTFRGEQWQRPPVFSAKQIKGQRAYHAARNGERPEILPVQVVISDIVIERCQLPELEIRVRCSKGTYIRALANDIGERAGSGAYLKALRRTESAPYRVDQAISPLALLNHLRQLAGLPEEA